MKTFRTISLRILLSFAVLYCLGASMASEFPLLPDEIECAAGAEHESDRLNPDPDLYHIDDQVPQPDKFLSVMESVEFKRGLKPSLFIPGFSVSVWQPPKTC